MTRTSLRSPSWGATRSSRSVTTTATTLTSCARSTTRATVTACTACRTPRSPSSPTNGSLCSTACAASRRTPLDCMTRRRRPRQRTGLFAAAPRRRSCLSGYSTRNITRTRSSCMLKKDTPMGSRAPTQLDGRRLVWASQGHRHRQHRHSSAQATTPRALPLRIFFCVERSTHRMADTPTFPDTSGPDNIPRKLPSEPIRLSVKRLSMIRNPTYSVC
mmetsp:Transcript_18983/g.45518  ORF Transcript_18983/g.45518 Transcript_18983/m.45518 type:complete len:217 (-) Transcript_18983:110-760(-)